jgi:hypothetical protein
VGTVLAAVAVTGAGIIAVRTAGLRPRNAPSIAKLSIEVVLSLDPRRIESLDLAAVNIACAVGLTGAEGVDERACLQHLDDWARHIQEDTVRNRHRFAERPDYYEHSEAKFKMIHLVLALQQDVGIVYDPAKRDRPDPAALADPAFFRDASGVFLCGVLGERRRGTCASIPMLVVCVGRRLGYPLKLVTTKGHVFVRWEDPHGGERFNIEASGRGVDFLPDSHYRRWPFPLAEREIAEEGFLKSLSPAEELSLCLELRGYCLTANKRHKEAAEALTAAAKYRPTSRNLRGLLDRERARSNSGTREEGVTHENPA